MGRLEGRVALVTGAAQGIGAEFAKGLAAEGAKVAISDLDSGQTVVDIIKQAGGDAIDAPCDVSDEASARAAVQKTVDAFGRLDILVNNAGSRPGPDRVPVVELSEEAWDGVQNVNAKGTFLCAQAVARHMIERGGGGRIINISSTAGRMGMPRFAAYCASKFAVIGFTQSLAHELAPHRINVNAVCPGTTLTERTGYIAAALNEQDTPTIDATQNMVGDLADKTPLGRVAEPEDVARTVAFLASTESDYTTGVALLVAGGIQM